MTDTDTAVEPDEIQHGTIMTDAADPEDKRPWTIKGMPEWVMDTARRAAKAKRMSMGEWLTEVIPMAAMPNGQADRGMPVVVRPKEEADRPKANAGPTLTEIADLAKQLSAIEGLPPAVLKEAHGLLRDKLKAARRN